MGGSNHTTEQPSGAVSSPDRPAWELERDLLHQTIATLQAQVIAANQRAVDTWNECQAVIADAQPSTNLKPSDSGAQC